MYCLATNSNTYRIGYRYFAVGTGGAWVPAITVCNQRLFTAPMLPGLNRLGSFIPSGSAAGSASGNVGTATCIGSANVSGGISFLSAKFGVATSLGYSAANATENNIDTTIGTSFGVASAIGRGLSTSPVFGTISGIANCYPATTVQ